MKHFVYLLYSAGYDKFYIGQTSSIELRLERHNEFEPTSSFTSKYRPWILKCFVETATRSDAMRLEKKAEITQKPPNAGLFCRKSR